MKPSKHEMDEIRRVLKAPANSTGAAIRKRMLKSDVEAKRWNSPNIKDLQISVRRRVK